MSYVEIYAIEKSGQLVSFAKVRNAMAGALHVWMQLSKRYLGDEYAVIMPTPQRLQEVWDLFEDPRLTRSERIVMGFTYDRVWVKRENVPFLREALIDFRTRHSDPQVHPTILDISQALWGFEATDHRGVCFNQTSVSQGVWWLSENDGTEESRLFDFSRDEKCNDGGKPWELFEAIGDYYEKQRSQAAR